MLFVVDGGHGIDIPHYIPLISVCHGTWVALWARADWQPEHLGFDEECYEPSQLQMYGRRGQPGRPNMLPVAVSAGAKRELVMYHNRHDAVTICNGVSTREFCPLPKHTDRARPIIIHAAADWRKGIYIIPKLQERLPHFDFQYLNAEIGEEPAKFARGDMFVHISCSEGNAYACLEAMSCNLPMVVTNVGLFESDVDSSIVGRVIPYVSTVEEICQAIEEVWETREKFNPREWILSNATFEHFRDNWHSLIENLEQLGLKRN